MSRHRLIWLKVEEFFGVVDSVSDQKFNLIIEYLCKQANYDHGVFKEQFDLSEDELLRILCCDLKSHSIADYLEFQVFMSTWMKVSLEVSLESTFSSTQ